MFLMRSSLDKKPKKTTFDYSRQKEKILLLIYNSQYLLKVTPMFYIKTPISAISLTSKCK